MVKRLDTTFSNQYSGPKGRITSRISVNPSVPRSAIENLNEQFNNLWQKSYMVSDVF
ncbi:MAG: hypothetical protein U5L09_13710 [Bacteroidales bacterium]|nr:hypothetical protein [Bacteroidales bacterium]